LILVRERHYVRGGRKMTLNTATPPIEASASSTVGAVVAGVVFVVPGYILGGVAAWIYMFFTSMGMDRYGGLNTWIPFLNGIFTVVWFYLMPEGIRGAVSTGAALFAASWIFKRADMGKVTFTVTGIWVTIGVLLLGLTFFATGPDIRHFGVVGTILGMLVGAYAFSSRDT